jgi:hypothetical protein
MNLLDFKRNWQGSPQKEFVHQVGYVEKIEYWAALWGTHIIGRLRRPNWLRQFVAGLG